MESVTTYLPVLLALLASVAIAYACHLKSRLKKAEQDREEVINVLRHLNHAIRTPLTTLGGVAEIMEADSSLSEGQRKIVNTLRGSTQSLKDIAASIPDYSTGKAKTPHQG